MTAANSPVRAINAEAINIPDPITVEITPGVEVRVLPTKQWRLSALDALQEGNFKGWAAKALASTEDYDTFMDADPTLAEVESFMQRLGEESTVGNSKTSSRSTRRSPRTRKS